MQRLSKERFLLAFEAGMEAAYRVELGETFVVETHDCHGGQVVREGKALDELDRSRCPNPATGPIEVAGVQPGETLAAQILDVKVAERGIVTAYPDTRLVDVREGCAVFAEEVWLPVDPVIGVIGVAPAEGAVPTTTPGDHGGNLDTRDVRAGTTVLLPVAAEGALLGMGDVHAVQGDGEISGTGVEIEAEITLRVERGPRLSDRPCLLWPGHVATVASAPEWQDAMKLACEDMIRLVCDRRGMEYGEAKMLVSLAGHLKVSQMVNPWMTARMVMPRELVRC